MATEVIRRGGSAQDHKSFTGANREWTHDDDLNAIRVHDNVRAGGHLMLRSGEVDSISANKTLALVDFGRLYDVDTSGADVTVTLPPAADATEGWQIAIRKGDAANALIIATNASETIDGQSGVRLFAAGSFIVLRSDGTNWTSFGTHQGVASSQAVVATDTATDVFEANVGHDVGDGDRVRVNFDGNTTTTPTFENTGGSPSGAKTITDRNGKALWANALKGDHDLKFDATADTWLVLDPNIVNRFPSISAADSGTDAYQGNAGGDLATNAVFFALIDSGNTTASPTFENTGGDPAGAQSIVTVNGHAWPGMLQNRVHRFSWDGSNVVVLDPNTIVYKSGVDATNGGANDLSAISFESLGSGLLRINIGYEGVSLVGTDDLLVQIGDSGGYETAGYSSGSAIIVDGATPSVAGSSSGFIHRIASAGTAVNGGAILNLYDAASNRWHCNHGLRREGTRTITGEGNASLSTAADRVRVTVSGTDTFNDGTIGAVMEYRP